MLTRKPRHGDSVTWPHWKPGRVATVTHTPDGDICWFQEPGQKPSSFIWRFREGLNTEAVILADANADRLTT